MNKEGFKATVCLIICVSLITATLLFGNSVGVAVSNAFLLLEGFISDEISITANSIGIDEKISTITGYGGGSYANSANTQASNADLEVLKQQAQKLFENYTKAGSVKEVQMGATSKTVSLGAVTIDNKTNQSVNIKSLLGTQPKYKKITKEEPYILIYHTHSTEGYELLDLGWYAKEYNSRTKDTNKNMVRVGDELTKVLENAGYKVIHDRNIYDESYDGAYARSRVSVEKYLKKYPSIQITLDVHRDAIHYSDGTKCKPTTEINNKKAAQVMIISGCEGNGVQEFNSWKSNLVFATHLQNKAGELYPGLMRPVFFCHRKYNMDVTPCSLLLEFGTDANTLEEAVYSAQLIGNTLVELLEKEVEEK